MQATCEQTREQRPNGGLLSAIDTLQEFPALVQSCERVLAALETGSSEQSAGAVAE